MRIGLVKGALRLLAQVLMGFTPLFFRHITILGICNWVPRNMSLCHFLNKGQKEDRLRLYYLKE